MRMAIFRRVSEVYIYSRYNNLTVAAEANASTVISFRLAS